MATKKVEDLLALNSRAVLKFLTGGLLIADGDAPIPDPATLVAATGELNIPAGYVPSGWMSTDAVSIDRSISVDTTKGWQSLATIRTDRTEDSLSYKGKFLEYNLVTFALRNGLTLADARKQFTAAGVAGKRDTSGSSPLRRGILIARDTNYNITLAQAFPSLTMTAQGSTGVGRSTEYLLDWTVTPQHDPVAQTDLIEAMNGPGMAALVGTASPATTA